MASGRRAWSLFNPGPLPGSFGGSMLGLPSSRVPPVETCPVLGPRWRPRRHRRSPVGMLLSALGSASAQPQHSPVFGAPYRGLSPRSSWLRTADCSVARKIRYRPADGFGRMGLPAAILGRAPIGQHWRVSCNAPIPSPRASLGAILTMVWLEGRRGESSMPPELRKSLAIRSSASSGPSHSPRTHRDLLRAVTRSRMPGRGGRETSASRSPKRSRPAHPTRRGPSPRHPRRPPDSPSA
jgi:hypothetical protein